MSKTEKELLEVALSWSRAGKRIAIASVVETWGSAPRAAGSLLIIDEDARMEGSVSGGCVEGAVVAEAIDAISIGTSRLLTYGVADDAAFGVGLACGGEIKILVEPVGSVLPLNLLEELVALAVAKSPVAYVVDMDSGARRIARPDEFPERFRLDRSGLEEDGNTFVRIHNAPLRLGIIGAVHVAQHLVPMAQAVGFDVAVIDPRTAFGTQERFPSVALIDDWPDTAVRNFAPDQRTAIVTLTHDQKLDEPALIEALATDAFYIGSLGSRRTQAQRKDHLRALGVEESALDRIHGPVGLAIGGRTPAEIAVSIIAEIVKTLRAGE